MEFLLIVIVAVIVGLAGSMLGIGGGLMLIPILTLFFDVPMKTAIGASLVSVIATSSAAQLVYVRSGLTHVRLGMSLEVTTALGALAGALVAVYLPARALQGIFVLLLIYAAVAMSGRRAAEAECLPTGSLDTRYVDPATSEQVDYGVRRLPLGMVLSFSAGNLAGLLGVGGGLVQVPLMNLVLNVPLKAAFATSNFMIGVTAATGAAVYFGRGLVDPGIAVPVALGVLVGAQLGPRLAGRMQTETLRWGFRALMVVFAAQMAWRVAG